MTRPSLIDTIFLGELRSSVTNFFKLKPTIAGVVSSEHLNTVHAHLAYLIELLESSLDPSVRKHLTSLAAECALILGEMYHDLHLLNAAERYFMIACTAAEEAGNLALKAVIRGIMSMLPEYSLALVQEALPWAKKHGTDTTYSWFQARNAEVYAEHLSEGAQYATECEKALEQATTFSSRGDPEHDPYWTCFDESLMYGYQGVCYIKLQKPEAAKIALLQDLQHSNPENTYHQTVVQIDLARVYQMQGDILNACLCGHHALAMISRARSLRLLQRLEEFRSNFPTGETDSALQAFDEHKMSVEEFLREHTHFEEVG